MLLTADPERRGLGVIAKITDFGAPRARLAGEGGWGGVAGCMRAAAAGARRAGALINVAPPPPRAGLSRSLSLNQTHVTTHSLGTITHMPPELFK